MLLSSAWWPAMTLGSICHWGSSTVCTEDYRSLIGALYYKCHQSTTSFSRPIAPEFSIMLLDWWAAFSKDRDTCIYISLCLSPVGSHNTFCETPVDRYKCSEIFPVTLLAYSWWPSYPCQLWSAWFSHSLFFVVLSLVNLISCKRCTVTFSASLTSSVQ